jgi:hypothetical protein
LCIQADLGFTHLVSPPISRLSGKSEQDYQVSTSKTMSRDRATLTRCITLALFKIRCTIPGQAEDLREYGQIGSTSS